MSGLVGKPRRSHNPFSTRHVRPGALPFLFPPGIAAGDLVERLERSGCWGQIVGPHGGGKSTLLQTLLPELRTVGRTIRLFELRAGQRQLPVDRAADGDWNEATLLVVDGYEQLSWPSRYRLHRRCLRNRSGLLVTTHRRCGLPELWFCATTLQQAQTLTRNLLQTGDPTAICADDVSEAFHACRGDLRETWFRLYDVYESRFCVGSDRVDSESGSLLPGWGAG